LRIHQTTKIPAMALALLCAVSMVSMVSMALAAATTPDLIHALKTGDRESFRQLLGQGAEVDAAEPDGSTALLWASYHDNIEAAELLVEAGADLDRGNDLGATPLWAASQNGSDLMVALLVDAGADPNARLLSGETPIMVAARSGYPDIVLRLIDAGGDPNARGARNQTALMWAAAQKHADVVRVLAGNGADLDARSEVWSQVMAVDPHGFPDYNKDIPHGGETALMFAARVGDLESAKALVRAGADVDDADAWGVSATSLAAHSGFTELVELLLLAGADPNANGPGFAALHTAIMHRDDRMVEALLAHGADANMTLDTWTPTRRSADDHYFTPELVGASPLWLAARFGTPDAMRMLAEHGADPMFVHHGQRVRSGFTGNAGQMEYFETTPLMAALGMGGGRAWFQPDRSEREALALEAVTLTVELGTDLNVADTSGRTALDAANGLRFQSVVEFLVANGALPGPAPTRGAGRGAPNPN
jgi:ankyrin repeat protein